MALHPVGPAERAQQGPAPDQSSGPESLTRPSIADRLDEALLKLALLRDRPLVTFGLAMVAVAVAVGGWWLGRPSGEPAVEAGIPMAAPLVPASTTSTLLEPAEIVVHVAGAVVSPGIVELEEGDRIVDAIARAGGATDAADLHQLNLAAIVSDGMQIRVPVPGELVPPNGTTGGAAGSGADPATGGTVDVNRASAAQLEELRGIGPSLANAIVEWREENGPFVDLDDLLSVPGIGPAKLDGLADDVVL